jgi:hypothetical protein
MELPPLPAHPRDFLSHLRKVLDSGTTVHDSLAPFKAYESKLREIYAQEPDNPVLATPDLNLVPLFAGQEALLSTHARDLSKETAQEKARYIMPLDDEWRRPHGSPAVVQSLKEFNLGFNLFSEQSLAELDWSNVVAAGSSVLTSLLPIPERHKATKKALR